jgi:hypothetical protein
MFFHGPWIKFEPQSSTVAALAMSIPPQKKNKHDLVDQSLVTCLGSQHVRKKRGFSWHARAQKVPVWIYSRGHPVVDTF